MTMHYSLKPTRMKHRKINPCTGQIRASQKKRQRKASQLEKLERAAEKLGKTITEIKLQRFVHFRQTASEAWEIKEAESLANQRWQRSMRW